VSQAENPQRLIRERSGEVSVEDVRELMGASTPHFALQLRERIHNLIKRLPEDHREIRGGFLFAHAVAEARHNAEGGVVLQ